MFNRLVTRYHPYQCRRWYAYLAAQSSHKYIHMPFFSLYFAFFSDITLDVGCLFIFHYVFCCCCCVVLFFLKSYLSIGLFSVCRYICLRFCCQCISIAILVSCQTLYTRYTYYLFSFYPNRTCNTSWHHSLFILYFIFFLFVR